MQKRTCADIKVHKCILLGSLRMPPVMSNEADNQKEQHRQLSCKSHKHKRSEWKSNTREHVYGEHALAIHRK